MSDERPRYSCPECGELARWDLTCHTFGTPETGMRACMPCDSATWWYCAADCGWEYTQGLNPRNPRSASNELKRPAWLPEFGPHDVGSVKPLGAFYDEDDD